MIRQHDNFLVELVDAMFSKQNETEPMKPDSLPKIYGQVGIIHSTMYHSCVLYTHTYEQGTYAHIQIHPKMQMD